MKLAWSSVDLFKMAVDQHAQINRPQRKSQVDILATSDVSMAKDEMANPKTNQCKQPGPSSSSLTKLYCATSKHYGWS